MPLPKRPFSIPDLSVAQFVQLTAKSKPDITGGCVVLTAAGLALGLILMTLEMSKTRNRNAAAKAYLGEQILALRKLQEVLTEATAHDLHVFNNLREFLGNGSEGRKGPLYRAAVIDSIESPLNALQILMQIMEITGQCGAFCKKSLVSDIESALLILAAALRSMLLFTASNLKSLPVQERKNYKISIRQNQNDIERLISDTQRKIKRDSSPARKQ